MDSIATVEPIAAENATVERITRGRNGFSHESTKNESVEWYTPKWVFEALGLTYDLDPCSPGPGKSHVPTKKHYTKEDDGLVSPWHGTVFMNPPYGNLTAPFMKKLAEHGDGIALVFARTDTKWFHDHIAGKATLVCFISSRIKFLQGGLDKVGGSPGAGSMLVAYGDKAAEAVLNSGLGACVQFATAPEKIALAS